MSEKRYFSISSKGNLTPINSIEEVINNHKNGDYLWVDLFDPTKEDLSTLVEPLGLHPLTIEDCTDENFVPKIEEYPRNTFIILNSFTYKNSELFIDEIDFIIGENYLVTVSGYKSDGRKPLDGIDQVVTRDIENAKKGPAFLLQIIMDNVVDKKFHAIDSLENLLDNTEDSLIYNPSSFDPSELVTIRRQLLTLRKSLFHEREILIKICRKDCPFISDKAIYHFRDIYDHLSKFFELTETHRDNVTSQMELHMSMLNNLMTKSSNQTNASVRRLTLISTIFLPLTLLASIGGMSEWSMMTGKVHWSVSYPLFILAMIIIGVLNYFFIKRLEKRNPEI